MGEAILPFLLLQSQRLPPPPPLLLLPLTTTDLCGRSFGNDDILPPCFVDEGRGPHYGSREDKHHILHSDNDCNDSPLWEERKRRNMYK